MYDSTILPPQPWEALLETRTILELGSFFSQKGRLAQGPQGDGHPVFIFPGFMVGDLSTLPMRNLFQAKGYQVFPWKLGPNLGYHDHVLETLIEKAKAVFAETNQPISVIGWSLGGLYARELARAHPEWIRQVITLGTPFARSLKASSIRSFYEYVSGNSADKVDPALFATIQVPPPVPTTAIYTKADGIVAWQTTMEQQESETVQNIEVSGSHCGLGHNLEVLEILLDRLAQTKENWQRFQQVNQSKHWQSKNALLRDTSQKLDQGLKRLEMLLERH